MKKFQFSLGRMLNYKTTLLDREKDLLHALHGERIAQEQSIASAEEQMLAMDREMRESAVYSTTAVQMRQHSFTMENTRRLLEQLRQELIEIIGRVERQTAVVLELSQEVSGLEKLRDKQRGEYDYEANREESERILEMVSGQYIAAQSR